MTLGKRRVRAHIIGALGVNHVERQILLAGYVLEKTVHDYDIDGFIQTFDKTGLLDRTVFGVQIKATEKIKLNKS